MNFIRNAGTLKDYPPYEKKGLYHIYRVGYEIIGNPEDQTFSFVEKKTLKKLSPEEIAAFQAAYIIQFGQSEKAVPFNLNNYQ